MFGIFPCFWTVPGRKPIKHLAHPDFPPRTARISRPVPEAVRIERPNGGFADYDYKKLKIPVEEMCIGENIDTTEIDLMLKNMGEQCSR